MSDPKVYFLFLNKRPKSEFGGNESEFGNSPSNYTMLNLYKGYRQDIALDILITMIVTKQYGEIRMKGVSIFTLFSPFENIDLYIIK